MCVRAKRPTSPSVLLPPGLRGAELLITQGSGATTAQSRVLSEFLGEWEHLLESGEKGRDKDHVMVKGWLDLPLMTASGQLRDHGSVFTVWQDKSIDFLSGPE